jgi:hypothetical protein
MEVFNDGTPTSYQGDFVVGTPPAEKPGNKLNDKDKEELKKLFDAEKAKVDELERRAREAGILPPLGRDSKFKSALPGPGNGNGEDAGIYLPPLASTGAEVDGTVIDQSDTGVGPKSFYIATVDANGERKVYRGLTDAVGRFRFRLPALVGITAVEVFRRFDRNGRPDRGARCQVTNAPQHLRGLQRLKSIPASGPAIVEGNSAYDRAGESQGLVQMQTRGIEPHYSNVSVDGRPTGAKTLAASDRSIVAKLDSNLSLGLHTLALTSGTTATNGYSADVITQRFDPLPAMTPGNVYPVRLHVEGVPAADQAAVVFAVSGSAELATRAASQRVPIQDGVATVQIRALHAGAVSIRTRIEVARPELAPPNGEV